jgi:choline-sulfatase
VFPVNEPTIVREQQKFSDRTYPTVNWTADQWRQYRWAYNRLVEKVDGYIGMLLGSLHKYGVEKNTIIVFTADHGDGYGAHRWNQKQILYEEAARVPFIVAKLGQWKGRTDDMLVCNGTDMIPTLCGFAAIKSPADLRGANIGRRIANPQLRLRDTLVIETDFADNDRLLGISGRAVITGNWKYIVYDQGQIREQLFDLGKDPGEMNNLALQVSYKKQLQLMSTYLKQWCRIHHDNFNAQQRN